MKNNAANPAPHMLMKKCILTLIVRPSQRNLWHVYFSWGLFCLSLIVIWLWRVVRQKIIGDNTISANQKRESKPGCNNFSLERYPGKDTSCTLNNTILVTFSFNDCMLCHLLIPSLQKVAFHITEQSTFF